MRITFNSPAVLTFTVIAVVVQALSDTIFVGFNHAFFASTGHFDFGAVADYFRLVSHAAGHDGWAHLVGNFSIILLIGPILEEKYGTKDLAFMMIFTAAVTGVLNVAFWDTGLLGASGIVFMMILLGSLVNLKSGTIPLTFILILLLYMGNEVLHALGTPDQVSQFAHIVGGLCGMGFGFLLGTKRA
jgi:membrane associated rhomboid family serine protease